MPTEIKSTPIKVELPPAAEDAPTSAEPASDSPPNPPPGEGEAGADSAPGDVEPSDTTEPAEKGPKEPKEPKETPSESAYARVLKQREQRITRREVENGKRHETLTANEARVQAAATQLQQREASITEQVKLIEADPIAFLVKHRGWREEDIARRFLTGGAVSPQEADHRREQAFKTELAARDAKIDELKALIEDAVVKPRQAEAATASAAKARADYQSFGKAESAKYPHVARALAADPEGTTDLADSLAVQMIQGGYKAPSVSVFWHEVSSRLNAKLSKISGAGSALPAADAATKGTENQGQKGQEATSKVAPTLSGKGAAQRATVVEQDDPLEEELKDPHAFRQKTIANARKAKTAA